MTTLLLGGALAAFADVKIRTRQTAGGQATESTIYIKGKRQRSERDFGGLKTVTLTQCDLRRDVQLNERARTYFISLYENGGAAGRTAEASIQNPKSKLQNQTGGVVTTTVTLRDTGERKQLFGYTARRILTTVETVSSPDACAPVNTKMETDGWYIDADFALNCLTDRHYRPDAASGNRCQDRQIFKQNGAGKLGYPVYLKTVMRGADGGEDFVSVQEVLEISPAALDAALFDVPAGFREVKTQAEVFTGGMNGPDADEPTDDENEEPRRTSPDVKPPAKTGGRQTAVGAAPTAASTPTAPGPKQNGVIRLGVAAVRTGRVGEGINAEELSAAVEKRLAEYLRGAKIELVRIDARTPAAIAAEATEKSCDFVISAVVSHKKAGGFGKVFGRIAPVVADAIPGSERSVEANTAINAGRGAIYDAGAAAQNIKAKDELTLEIELRSAGAAVLARQLKAKAKSDGDDIISPLVEQAAVAIRQAALNGRQ